MDHNEEDDVDQDWELSEQPTGIYPSDDDQPPENPDEDEDLREQPQPSVAPTVSTPVAPEPVPNTVPVETSPMPAPNPSLPHTPPTVPPTSIPAMRETAEVGGAGRGRGRGRAAQARGRGRGQAAATAAGVIRPRHAPAAWTSVAIPDSSKVDVNIGPPKPPCVPLNPTRVTTASIRPRYATEPPDAPPTGGPSTLCTLSGDDDAKDYFDLFISQLMRAEAADYSRQYAQGMGAGGSSFPEYNALFARQGGFQQSDVNCLFALLLQNGLHPCPDILLWLKDPEKDEIWGDERVRKHWGTGGRATLKLLRSLFHLSPPVSRGVNVSDPLFKLNPFLNKLKANCEKLWWPGQFLSLDEQTIGFRGRSCHKLRIKYKKEGDGFQADALCEQGYTWSWVFRFEKVSRTPHYLCYVWRIS